MTTYYVTTSGSDSNAGTSEGAAFATIGKACSVALTSGDRVYVKSGTYVLASDTPDVAGGVAVVRQGVHLIGYESTIDDNCPTGDRPVFDASGFSTFTNNVGLVNLYNETTSRDAVAVKNMRLLGVLGLNGATTGRPRAGVSGSGAWSANLTSCYALIDNCVIEGFYHAIEHNFNSPDVDLGTIRNCYLGDSVLTFQNNVGNVDRCHIKNWYKVANVRSITNSVIEYVGDGSIGTFNGGVVSEIQGCIVVNNSTSSGAYGAEIIGRCIDCMFIGFPTACKMLTDQENGYIENCYSFGETTLIDYSAVSSSVTYLDDITSLTEDPFVDSANLDFTLTNTNTSDQELGQFTTLRDGVARGLNWYKIAGDVTGDPNAYYPFRFAAGGDFESDVARFHPLRENR